MKWLPLAFGMVMVVGGMVLRHVLWAAAQSDGGNWADFLRLVYYPTWCRVDGLIFGVGLAGLRVLRAELWARWMRPAWLLPVAAMCLAGAVGMTVTTGQTLGEVASVVVYPLFSLGVALLLAAVVELEPRLQALRWSGLGFIAAISYSLYLSQKLVFAAEVRWLPASWTQGWPAVVVFYVGAIAVATVLWACVERPFLVLRGRVLNRYKRGLGPEAPES